MDIGLIFRTGDPLDRKHYLVGNLILWSVPIVVLGVARLLTLFAGEDSKSSIVFKLSIALLMIWGLAMLAYTLLFRLRRIVDIGFKNRNSAGFALIGYALIAAFAGQIHPFAQVVIVSAFEIALFATPTGWNIREPELPRQERW